MAIVISDNIESSTGCIASAMNVLGQKWTALILRDLFEGPKRFCELERSVGNINPRTLTQRLIALERQNIIAAKDGRYLLTKKGVDLLPILRQMATWGEKYPTTKKLGVI